jgi:hypothetical protein
MPDWLFATLRQYPEIAIFLALGLGYYFGKFTFRGIGLGSVTATLPDWSVRVSFANLNDDVYDDIGRAVRAVARGYYETYQAVTGKTGGLVARSTDGATAHAGAPAVGKRH